MAFIPDDLVSLPAEADTDDNADAGWAAWVGVSCAAVGGRSGVVLVSITVAALTAQPGGAAGAGLVALVRARRPELGGAVEEFTTTDGCAAVTLRGLVTQKLRGRDVTTGQAQALVVYPGPGALGVVSGICFHADDLDRAAAIVGEIATRMTVTGVTAAA